MDDLAEIDIEEVKERTIWRGPDRHSLTSPISNNGRIMNIVGFFPPALEDDYVESWKKEGRSEDLLSQVNDWDPLVSERLKRVTDLRQWSL
jgi:hypothetical protein